VAWILLAGWQGFASPFFCETPGRLSVASCPRFVNYSGAFPAVGRAWRNGLVWRGES
jgi:hypothetical protein